MIKNLPEIQETQVQSLGREDPLEEEIDNLLQYSCLENSLDRGAWKSTVHGVTKSQTQLSRTVKSRTLYLFAPGLPACEQSIFMDLLYLGFLE